MIKLDVKELHVIISALKEQKADTVEIRIEGDKQPVLFTAVYTGLKEQQNIKCLLMPMI